MSSISRPAKTGGNTTYVAEVADGNTIIKAVEVDADFDTIYTDYDGNITNANISPTANIATAKLAQDGGIVAGHLATGSVTSAKILDGTIVAADLAADSVTTSKILDGSITLAKMGVGSTVRYGEGPSDESPTAITTSEGTVLTFASFTPAGATSIISLHVTVNGTIDCLGSGGNIITIRVKRNGSTIATAQTTITLATGTIVPFTKTIHKVLGLLTGAQVFTVTAQSSAVFTGTWSINTEEVYGSVVEHA